MVTHKYYFCNKNDEKLLECDALIAPQGIFFDNIKVLNTNLPEEININNLSESLNFYVLANLNFPFKTGYELDETIMNDLKLSSDILKNGRLDNLWYLRQLLYNHFMDNEGNYFTCKESSIMIMFVFRMIGFNQVFFDEPVTYETARKAEL